jgi:hypothetical protein
MEGGKTTDKSDKKSSLGGEHVVHYSVQFRPKEIASKHPH